MLRLQKDAGAANENVLHRRCRPRFEPAKSIGFGVKKNTYPFVRPLFWGEKNPSYCTHFKKSLFLGVITPIYMWCLGPILKVSTVTFKWSFLCSSLEISVQSPMYPKLFRKDII